MPPKDDPSILGAEWVNQRFLVVLDGVYQLIDRMLTTIYEEGFGPLEQPITDVDIKKMTSEAFQQVVDDQLTDSSKGELVKRAAKLPGIED